MTNPSLDDVRSAIAIVNKTKVRLPLSTPTLVPFMEALEILIALGESYLEVSGDLPKEMKEKTISLYRADDPSYEEGVEWNECLSLCRLAYLKQAKRVEELEESIKRDFSELNKLQQLQSSQGKELPSLNEIAITIDRAYFHWKKEATGYITPITFIAQAIHDLMKRGEK
jgi:hypothetical protein